MSILLLTYPPLHSGLEFTQLALAQNLSKPTEELSASFISSYGATLKPHHSFVIKPIFSLAMSAVPYRVEFYKKLGESQALVEEKLKEWLDALGAVVLVLKAFLASKDAKW